MGGRASQMLCHLDNQHSEVIEYKIKEGERKTWKKTSCNQNNQRVVEVSGFSNLVKIAELCFRDFLT